MASTLRPPAVTGASQAVSPGRRSKAAPGAALGAVAALLLCFAPLGAKQAAPAQQEKPPAQEAPAAAEQPAAYVGSETCQTCHEDIYDAFIRQNPHRIVNTEKKRGWEGRACEACHGPGSKHAESADASLIRNPAKLPAAETDRICLQCHLNQPTQIGRIENGHARNAVACTACHSIHKGPEAMVARKYAAVNTLCGGCHTSELAQFNRPYHHRIPEGAMSCVDCHNPHGSILRGQLQTFASNEPSCFRCHADKRGPFTFEHAPMRLEGCMTCHEPHGSANPRMLVRQEVRFVCLQCHANLPTPPASGTAGLSREALGTVPPAFHDLLSPRFRNCTICHQKVHGSYVNRFFLR